MFNQRIKNFGIALTEQEFDNKVCDKRGYVLFVEE